MKNKLKILIIMSSLLQGTSTFAQVVTANINSGGAYKYLITSVAPYVSCPQLELAAGSPQHVSCQVEADEFSKTKPKVLLFTLRQKNAHDQDIPPPCPVNGSLSDESELQLTAADFCFEGAVFNGDTVQLQ